MSSSGLGSAWRSGDGREEKDRYKRVRIRISYASSGDVFSRTMRSTLRAAATVDAADQGRWGVDQSRLGSLSLGRLLLLTCGNLLLPRRSSRIAGTTRPWSAPPSSSSCRRARRHLSAAIGFGTTQRIASPEPKLLNPIGWLGWAGKWEQPNRDIL
jgi:hypothetical protein